LCYFRISFFRYLPTNVWIDFVEVFLDHISSKNYNQSDVAYYNLGALAVYCSMFFMYKIQIEEIYNNIFCIVSRMRSHNSTCCLWLLRCHYLLPKILFLNINWSNFDDHCQLIPALDSCSEIVKYSICLDHALDKTQFLDWHAL